MESKYKASKPGVNYDAKTGKLYDFTSSSITVMRAWPPVAWKKTRRKPTWSHVRPKIFIPCRSIKKRISNLTPIMDENGQFLLPLWFPFEQADWPEIAWYRWSTNIPIEIRDTVCRFPKRQWHMLSLLARCGQAAYDLTLSNPALAFALASNWVYRSPAVKRPLRSARALLKPGKKQKDILNWLKFPHTESTRKTLAKIVHASIDIPVLLYVRQAMQNMEMRKAISHLQRLNAGSIRIATDPELLSLVTPNFLEEIANRRKEDERPKAAYILRDSVDMHRILFPNRRRIGPIGYLSQLENMHDTLIDDLNQTQIFDREIPFPATPIKGNEYIEPVTSVWGLMEEGRVQNNCVASYINKVAVHQQIYIYKVLWPERCTLALQRRGGKWILAELKRARNKSASRATRRAVEKWFNNYILESSRTGP